MSPFQLRTAAADESAVLTDQAVAEGTEQHAGLSAEYAGNVYAFDHFDRNKIHVYRSQDSGSSCEIRDFVCENAPKIWKVRTTLLIHTDEGSCELEVTPIPLCAIEASYEGKACRKRQI